MKKVIPWLLLIAGVALVAFAGVSGVRSFVSALQPVAEWESPGTRTVALDPGTWVVYQAGPPANRGGLPDERMVDWQDVTVTGPAGPVATGCVYCAGHETLETGSRTYYGIVRFSAETQGDYTITTETTGADLAISQSALRTVSDAFSSLAWIGVGGLLIAGAVVWLLVLLVQYLSRPKAQAPPERQSPLPDGPQAPPGDSWPPPRGPAPPGG